MTTGYRIADEPMPGRLAGWVVNPLWPLLAAMLAGFWLALPWFALNGVAMGSATRRRELAWIVGGAILSAATGAALWWAPIPLRAFRYGLVALVAWRLAVAYAVYQLQQSTFELHQHFGGAVRSGAMVVVAAALLPVSRVLGRDGMALLVMLVG